MSRKTLLLALTALMAVSGGVVALASNYATYMVGRALIGVVIGGFWSMSAATAMRLVPADQVPMALTVFNGGNALATVIAAPLGSYLGSVMGWRGAFFCLVPVAAIVLVWQWISLPAMQTQQRAPGSGNVFKILGSRRVALGMAACGALFHGAVRLVHLRATLSGNGDARERACAVADSAGDRRGRLHRHRADRRRPRALPIRHLDHDSGGDGGHRPGADPLRSMGCPGRGAPGRMGLDGDLRASRLVDLDRRSHAAQRRGRRRPDGGGDPVGLRASACSKP